MEQEHEGPEEAGSGLSSSSPPKEIVEPESLPGGRSSAAVRRVGPPRTRRRYTAEQRAELLDAFEASGLGVEQFAAERGVHPSTLNQWRYRERHGGKRAPDRAERPRSFSPEARRAALEAWAKSGLPAYEFARLWGVSSESLRAWRRAFDLGGPKALEPKKRGRPAGKGRSQLPTALQEEIVRTKRRFPSFGLKKVRDFLARFQGQRVSTGSVRKVLRTEGLHATPRPPRKRRKPAVRRFERARPGELWQTDITSYVLTRSRVRVYLTVFLDDFSRYVVSWQLATQQRSQLVCEALLVGIERFGKPKEVLSDQGRQYFAWRGKSDFQRLLAREGIRHVVARTHHPETLGKCERLWETIGTELWERAQPQELFEARERLAHYFAHYNHFRPHQGIGGLVPADRFFGAENALRKTLEGRMEKDELTAALAQTPRQSVYVFGQVGDQQVSLHGERGRIVLVTSDGVSKELALEDLGLPQQQETSDERREPDRDERADLGAAHAAGQEAAGLPAAEERAALGAVLVGDGGAGGAHEGAHDVHRGPVDVAGQEEPHAGGGGAGPAAAAGVAAQPGGALGYARGPLEAAPQPGRGDERDGDEQRGRSAGLEAADSRAGGGEPLAQGAPGGHQEPAVGAARPRGADPEDEVEAGDSSWTEEGCGTPPR